MNGWTSHTGHTNGNGVKSDPEPVEALPASWYRSNAMFELERRAIFSQKWLLASHRLRFPHAGSYLRLVVADFAFFLVRDREGEIFAHHNVCRHRAHPLVDQDSGKLSTVTCKYHGWSYGFNGKLAKAPQYQEFPSFDKSSNGLFKLHVHVDHLGFVWVNLDSQTEPAVKWDDDFAGVDTHPRFDQFNMENFHFDYQWDLTCDFNWKLFGDNYNECYHCPTGHPALNSISDFSKYFVETSRGHIQHFNIDKEGIEETKKHGVCSTFYYPTGATTITPDLFYVIRCIPLSSSQTRVEYEVYRHNNVSDEMFDRIHELFKVVQTEDKALSESVQANLNKQFFTNGELHPRLEEGPVYFQRRTRDLVMEHRQEEEAAGHEIWPAKPKRTATNGVQGDIDFCSKLDCGTAQIDSELSW